MKEDEFMNELTLKSSFCEWCNYYLHEKEANAKNNKTWYVRRKQSEKHLYPWIGDIEYGLLDYQDYIAVLAKNKISGFSNATIGFHWTTIRQTTLIAVSAGIINTPEFLKKTAEEMLVDVNEYIEQHYESVQNEVKLPDPDQFKNIVITRRSSLLVYLISLYNSNDKRTHHKITWAIITAIFRFVKDEILNTTLADLNRYDIRRICHDIIESGYGDEYIRVILFFVKFALNDAFEKGIIDQPFSDAFHIPKSSRGDGEFHFKPDEYERIIKEIQNSDFANLYTLVDTIGVSRSEALALKAGFYDKTQGTLTIGDIARTKTWRDYEIIKAEDRTRFKKRTILLPQKARNALEDELSKLEEKRKIAGDYWNATENYIFTNQNGGLISTDDLFFDMEKIRLRSGVENFSLNNLRKNCIYRMVKNNIYVMDVKEYLGFKSLDSILALYDNASQNEWREAVV